MLNIPGDSWRFRGDLSAFIIRRKGGAAPQTESEMPRPILMKGHERPITQVKYNIEGDLIFSSSKDSLATCWRSDTGERLGARTYDGHKGAINTLDIDRKTQMLATGASDRTVRLWKAETGEELCQFETQSAVRSVNFSLGDRLLLAAQD
eukprot:1314954-Amorphochlora_amoeboformis.AAC.1